MVAVADVLAVANAERGYVESGGSDGRSGNITKYWAELQPSFQGQPWCAGFVSWVFIHARTPLPRIDMPWGFAGVRAAASYARQHGVLYSTPEVGDIALYTFGQWHTGIVTHVGEGGYFDAIEGNTSPTDAGSQSNGGGVYLRRRHVSQTEGGGGFYRPNYTEEDDIMAFRFTHRGGIYVSDGIHRRHVKTPGLNDALHRARLGGRPAWPGLDLDGGHEVADDVFDLLVDLDA